MATTTISLTISTTTTTTTPVASGGEQVGLEEPCHDLSEQVQESVRTDWLDEFPLELTELLGCARCCETAEYGYSGCYEHCPDEWVHDYSNHEEQWGDSHYNDEEEESYYHSDEEEECSCAFDPPMYRDCHVCGYEC